MRRSVFHRLAAVSLIFWLSGCQLNLLPPPQPRFETVAEGLVGPIGLALLPDGSLLVAEAGTGDKDNSAGVTLIKPNGDSSRLVSGLPSSRDSGDLAGVNLVALAPGADRLYIGNFGQDQLWTLPLAAVQEHDGRTPLTSQDLTPAMQPLNNVRLINPFDLTFDPAGVPVVTDASGNGVATENPDGTTRFFHRFDRLPNPVTPNPNDTIEAVPTGISRIGERYYVTLTGGCPYPEGGGQLVAIDEQRRQETIIAGLNMPIDVAQGPDGAIWLLEFARFTPGASCFTGEGYQPRSGRLSRLQADGTLQPVLDGLNFPGAVLPAPDGSLYLTDVFSGGVLRVTFE